MKLMTMTWPEARMMYPIFTNKILDDELFTTFIISQLFVNRLLGNLLEYLRLITGLFSAAARVG